MGILGPDTERELAPSIEEIALKLVESWGSQSSTPDCLSKFINYYKYTLEDLEKYYKNREI